MAVNKKFSSCSNYPQKIKVRELTVFPSRQGEVGLQILNARRGCPQIFSAFEIKMFATPCKTAP